MKILSEAISKALADLEIQLPKGQIVAEPTTDPKLGDYTTNIAMQLYSTNAKKFKNEDINSARDLADKLVHLLQQDKNLSQTISKIVVAGPGFINFSLADFDLVSTLESIIAQKGEYGRSQKNQGKKVIVEYSSINIAKPFTIGHLRSTIIGDAVANLLEATGWEVLRDNHVGDWGSAFGKQIYALINLGEGSLEKNIQKINSSENPVKELVNLYIEFHAKAEDNPELEEEAREWFKKLEEGDKQAREIWQMCINWSWSEFEKIYDLLGVKFSKEFENGRGLGESFFEDKMQPVIDELQKKNLLQEGEGGAKLVFFENDKLPPAMIVKSNGTSLYMTRDLAADKFRKENYQPDLIINEIGNEQKLYMQQLFEIEEMLDWYKKMQRFHLAHSLIRFKDSKMSTRKGNVIWLQEVLNEAIKKANELGEGKDGEVDQLVAVGALKYNDLKRDPLTEYTFDWDEILNMQGNSGPYLQYTYARARSLLNKGSFERSSDWQKSLQGELENTLSAEGLLVLRMFPHFPEVVEEAAERYAPNLLCNYLYELAQRFNSFYNSEKIIEGEREEFKLALTAATAQILQNGLGLLGIATLERM